MASRLGLLLGIVLLSITLRQWRRRARGGDEVKMPRWMAALDQVSPWQAVGAGMALSALNPKNVLLGIVGAAAIARSGVSADQQAVAYAAFVLIATIGVGAPVLIFLAMGERSRTLLDALRRWMERNNAVIVALLLLVIGVKVDRRRDLPAKKSYAFSVSVHVVKNHGTVWPDPAHRSGRLLRLGSPSRSVDVCFFRKSAIRGYKTVFALFSTRSDQVVSLYDEESKRAGLT
jgi:hypothetical protein